MSTDPAGLDPTGLEQPGLAAPAPHLATVAAVSEPEAPRSPLAGLRRRRDEARARSFIDLRAPGYDPPIYVRFRTIQPGEAESINARHAKVKDEERAIRINTSLLARLCLGVFTVDADGDPVGDPATWPRFDADLAAELEMDLEVLERVEDKSAAVVREFYPDPIDITVVGDRLQAWSLKMNEDLARDAPKG